MNILAPILIAYTAAMLAIHVSTAKILDAWNGAADSWISRRFPPQRALRTEALYWILVLAGWSLWSQAGWRIAILIFAIIHIAIWAAGETRAIRLSTSGDSAAAHKERLAIIAFDLAEAVVLVAVAVFAVRHLLSVY